MALRWRFIGATTVPMLKGLGALDHPDPLGQVDGSRAKGAAIFQAAAAVVDGRRSKLPGGRMLRSAVYLVGVRL